MLGPNVSGNGSRQFATKGRRQASPLAETLFAIDGVSAVYFGGDFLTVRRDPDSDLIWAQLKAPILAAIMDFYTSGQPILREAKAAAETVYEGELGQIVAEIKDLLDNPRPPRRGPGRRRHRI